MNQSIVLLDTNIDVIKDTINKLYKLNNDNLIIYVDFEDWDPNFPHLAYDSEDNHVCQVNAKYMSKDNVITVDTKEEFIKLLKKI